MIVGDYINVVQAERRLGQSHSPATEIQLALSRLDEVGQIGLPMPLIRRALPWTTMIATVSVLIFMQAPGGANNNGGGGSRRQPPSWSPEREAQYPFRYWAQDLLAWSILSTDMDAAQQTAAIVLQLGGAARDLARHLSYQDLTTGGMVDGIMVDPVSYLLHHLATHFAPLGEEARLSAVSELMQFSRRQGESIDGLLSRFLTLRYRATQGGNNMAMSWEGYSWLLLRACGVNQHQLLNILQPLQGRFPANEQEFTAMQLTLRRMGHILESAPHNVAAQLRTAPRGQTFFMDHASEPQAAPEDPWMQPGQDPWAGSAPAAEQQWGEAAPAASPTYYAPATDDYVTDTETASSWGDQPPDGDEATIGMTAQQVDEHLFWAYQQAKSRWRRHLRKPTRRVRRFLRRSGKGKGKGKRRFAFLAELTDEQYDSVFFGGKGKSKGKRRSTGKGKGRRRNPLGADGEVMRCSICNSDTHFRAQCPQNSHAAAGSSSDARGSTFASYVDAGPIGDLLTAGRQERVHLAAVASDPGSSSTVQSTWIQVDRASEQGSLHSDSWVWPQASSAPGTAAAPPAPATNSWAQWSGNVSSIAGPPPSLAGIAGSRPATSRPADATPTEGQGATWEQMLRQVAHTWDTSVPQARAELVHPDSHSPEENFPLLANFRELQDRRVQLRRDAHRRPNHPGRPWEALANPPQTAGTTLGELARSDLWSAAIPGEARPTRTGMRQHQQAQANRRAAARQLLQVRRAQRGGSMYHDSTASQEADDGVQTPRQTPDAAHMCTICRESMLGEEVATLECMHKFHVECIDEWVSHSIDEYGEQEPVPCPLCRRETNVVERGVLVVPTPDVYQLNTPTPSTHTNVQYMDSPATYITAGGDSSLSSNDEAEEQSADPPAQVMPWWPVPPSTGEEMVAPFYHAATQLPGGKLSMIVDIGAWTNLMGENLCRELSRRAITYGHKPVQDKVVGGLTIQGVGNGTQECRWQVTCPIAVPYEDGQARLHKITAPIVGGAGADLPGLLGLRSLEHERSIIDAGKRMLYFVGKGEAKIELPPGSAAIPLKKAPSGHLVIEIDEYEKLKPHKGGLPEASLQLHVDTTDRTVNEPEGPSEAESRHATARPADADEEPEPVSRHLQM